jgi:hypothetical protein
MLKEMSCTIYFLYFQLYLQGARVPFVRKSVVIRFFFIPVRVLVPDIGGTMLNIPLVQCRYEYDVRVMYVIKILVLQVR